MSLVLIHKSVPTLQNMFRGYYREEVFTSSPRGYNILCDSIAEAHQPVPSCPLGALGNSIHMYVMSSQNRGMLPLLTVWPNSAPPKMIPHSADRFSSITLHDLPRNHNEQRVSRSFFKHCCKTFNTYTPRLGYHVGRVESVNDYIFSLKKKYLRRRSRLYEAAGARSLSL